MTGQKSACENCDRPAVMRVAPKKAAGEAHTVCGVPCARNLPLLGELNVSWGAAAAAGA